MCPFDRPRSISIDNSFLMLNWGVGNSFALNRGHHELQDVRSFFDVGDCGWFLCNFRFCGEGCSECGICSPRFRWNVAQNRKRGICSPRFRWKSSHDRKRGICTPCFRRNVAQDRKRGICSPCFRRNVAQDRKRGICSPCLGCESFQLRVVRKYHSGRCVRRCQPS
jgi:hypothetical protein